MAQLHSATAAMGNCLPTGDGLQQESKLPDGTVEAQLNDEEVLRLKNIFNKIADKETADGQKALSVHELAQMATLLGEQHTAAEATDAIARFHGPGGASPDQQVLLFDEFLAWWKYEHATDSGKSKHRGSHYSARFKLNIEQVHANFELSRLFSETAGEPGTPTWRLYFYIRENDDNANSSARRISPWHQIPLWADGLSDVHEFGAPVHFCCEIPQETRPKFEIATTEIDNPIHQDVKNGQLREYQYAEMPHNYGALPQTWEDPNVVDKDTGLGGDNDPLDAVEISGESLPCGAVVRAKVLGALAMIDDGETDWKVIVVAEGTELHDLCENCEDVDQNRPGLLDNLREWFRLYKTAEGKPKNSFALDEKYTSAEFAQLELLRGTHEMWKQLMRRGVKPKL
eukprot:SAG31_NODE_3011_length_4788_cov_5.207080_1_plen_400_part_00